MQESKGEDGPKSFKGVTGNLRLHPISYGGKRYGLGLGKRDPGPDLGKLGTISQKGKKGLRGPLERGKETLRGDLNPKRDP